MSDLLSWLRMVADAYKSVGDDESADYGYQAATLIEQLQQRNAELEQELKRVSDVNAEHFEQRNAYRKEADELAATVERLCESINYVLYDGGDLTDLAEVVEATPPQNLNAVKREVFIEGAKFGESLQSFDYDIGTDVVIQKEANTKYPSGKDGG